MYPTTEKLQNQSQFWKIYDQLRWLLWLNNWDPKIESDMFHR